jgi:hypothetical protein
MLKSTIREDIHQRFSGLENLVSETFPEDCRGPEAFKYALELYIRTIPETGSVDGWDFLHIIQETENLIHVIGLMYILPESKLPMDAHFTLKGNEVNFEIRLGKENDVWSKMSDDKKWNLVYSWTESEHLNNWDWEKPIIGIMQSSL